MGDYESTTTVRIAPDKLFDYLSDVRTYRATSRR